MRSAAALIWIVAALLIACSSESTSPPSQAGNETSTNARPPALKSAAWEALNSIDPVEVIRAGRVYGGGLRKVEPKELGRVGAQRILDLLNA